MKYGLIGKSLVHSFSKTIHERLADYTYEIKELDSEELGCFMKAHDFQGINVTVPYKSEIIPYLDYIDPVAEKIGAVNTVINRDGRLYGYNTDFSGLKMLIEKSGFDYEGRKVLILGTGGTSKTAVAVAGYLGARETVIVGRREAVNYTNVYSLHGDADYIINTTPVGMYPDCDGCPVELSYFEKLRGVTDVVYNPMKTRLLQKAEALGIKGEGGLYMLVCQAVFACGLFTGRETDVKKTVDRIFSELVKEKQNIVLIGMPGCGKTTIGRALSEATGKAFIDTDAIIEEEYGTISDIFSEKGEEYFRKIESSAVQLAAKANGTVISTGGGAVLKRENLDRLRQNGVVVFLNRPLEDITPTDDRPLAADRVALERLYDERYDIYRASADAEISVSADVGAAVTEIMEKLK